jgi:MFS family permease
MEVVIAQSRKDGWVIGLISAGHFLSHFYYLTLPPMFPLLKAEFSVSYVELGLAMTAYALLGGLIQVPVGFLVDHLFGARKVLLAGLGLTALAVTLIGFVHVYWALLVLAVIAGIGNSVFHPADYTILSSSIGERRLGRAFSIHTFFGFLGTACAPPVMLALSGWLGWRLAFIGVDRGGAARGRATVERKSRTIVLTIRVSEPLLTPGRSLYLKGVGRSSRHGWSTPQTARQNHRIAGVLTRDAMWYSRSGADDWTNDY